MQPLCEFTHEQKSHLYELLSKNTISPYENYREFSNKITSIINNLEVPSYLFDYCQTILKDRKENNAHVHVIGNCPVDKTLPWLDLNDPVNDKYKNKKTFISESFMELMSRVLETPLFSYRDRNNGDFFTDLVSFNKLKNKRSGFSDGDIIFHMDRACHPVRAEWISLLGLRCPKEEMIYTNYIDLHDMKKFISKEHLAILKTPVFFTEVDDLTKEENKDWHQSSLHEIITHEDKLRYQDTLTRVANKDDCEAKTALLAFKDAMAKAGKLRHRVQDCDLLIFSNQRGIHNREWIDVTDTEAGRKRWLLKTYSFESNAMAESHDDYKTTPDINCMSSVARQVYS